MTLAPAPIPLSLYIHIPWCIRKCPYCDFNSHAKPLIMPEQAYVARVIEDLEAALPSIWGRRLLSIFIGGGTPSVFSPDSINAILEGVRARIGFAGAIEITMEANPGTVDESRFKAFREAGVNRLSIGVQSFNPRHLQTLGRIHDGDAARGAIARAYNAGFDNINIDLMHGLSTQTLSEALEDVNIALSFQPQHLSWYQLTLEPNTVFYKTPPPLPSEDMIHDMQEAGWQLLQEHGFDHYEISAFSKNQAFSRHNDNYWHFGDYLGIGAGAHSKISDPSTGQIHRYAKLKQPKDYLDPHKALKTHEQCLNPVDLPFEFMLNALRLKKPIPFSLFEGHTYLPRAVLMPAFNSVKGRQLLQWNDRQFWLTPLGQRFANEAMELFLPTAQLT